MHFLVLHRLALANSSQVYAILSTTLIKIIHTGWYHICSACLMQHLLNDSCGPWFSFYRCLSQYSIFVALSFVWNCEESEIWPYLQANKLACQFYNIHWEKHRTSGSQHKPFINHRKRKKTKQNPKNKTSQSSVLHWFTTPRFPTGHLRARLSHTCALSLEYRRGNFELWDKDYTGCWHICPSYCLEKNTQRLYLYFYNVNKSSTCLQSCRCKDTDVLFLYGNLSVSFIQNIWTTQGHWRI